MSIGNSPVSSGVWDNCMMTLGNIDACVSAMYLKLARAGPELLVVNQAMYQGCRS